jgi:hypothetical protein
LEEERAYLHRVAVCQNFGRLDGDDAAVEGRAA